MSALVLPVELRRRVLLWSAARAPREACGLLLGSVGADGTVVVDVVECPNRAELALGPEGGPGELEHGSELVSEREFAIDPGDVVALDASARARGLDIVGVWHSHPDGEAVPSTRDAVAGWLSVPMVIAGLGRGRALRAWRREGAGFVEVDLVAQASCAARIAAHNLRPGSPEGDPTT